MRGRAIPFVIGAWLFLFGIVVQVFLAGMGLFELTDWTAHTGLGWALGMFVLLLPVLALIAGVYAPTLLATALLALLGMVQPELALARRENPVMAAFHPVNALVIFLLAWYVARASIGELRRAGSPMPAPDVSSRTPGDSAVGQEPAASPGTTV